MKKFVLTLVAFATAACGSTPPSAPSAPPRAAAVAAGPGSAPPRSCVPAPANLVVKDLQPGQGEPIVHRTAVMVGYTGWLYDGCVADLKGEMFDTSETRRTPLGLVVGAGRVIRGWDEGLVGMREGGKRFLVIPPDKGYGAAGAAGGRIPPNATLVFEVDLVKILQRP